MLYTVVQTEDKGRAIKATAKIDPGPLGFELFREEALFVMPTRGSPEDLSGPLPAILSKFDPQMWTDWWAFCQQSDSVKAKALDLYRDMTCPHAVCLTKYLRDKEIHKEEEKICDDDFDGGILDHKAEFVDFAMVIRYNAVELQPPNADGAGQIVDCGSGLFEIACKINHSCTPNCSWYTSSDGKQKIVRAISSIEANEELTLNYMNNELEPITQRRDDLRKYKGFICDCPRCSTSKGDDTRRFKCMRHGCRGAHFLDQPMMDTEPRFLPCTECRSNATPEYLKDMLKFESELDSEITKLEAMSTEKRCQEASQRIMTLKPPHELHALAERCFLLQAEIYSHQGKFRSAADSYRRQLECRDAILGPHGESITTAFTYELLGDMLSNVNLRKAEEAYQKSVRTLQFLRGGKSDPYSKCAMNKLLEVQSLRAGKTTSDEGCSHENGTYDDANDVDADGKQDDEGCDNSRSHPNNNNNAKTETYATSTGQSPSQAPCDGCAFCGNPSRLTSSCCNQVSYCCKEHAELHWNVIHCAECSQCGTATNNSNSNGSSSMNGCAVLSSVQTGSLHTICRV